MRHFLNRSIHSATAMACALLTGGLLVTAMAPASADDQIEQRIYQPDYGNKIKQSVYQDKNFAQYKQKAMQKLQSMGYSVDEIEADDYRQKWILQADVEKNDTDYEIRLSYPSLDILTIEED